MALLTVETGSPTLRMTTTISIISPSIQATCLEERSTCCMVLVITPVHGTG